MLETIVRCKTCGAGHLSIWDEDGECEECAGMRKLPGRDLLLVRDRLLHSRDSSLRVGYVSAVTVIDRQLAHLARLVVGEER